MSRPKTEKSVTVHIPLKELRIRAGFATQVALARVSGVDQQGISEIEGGQTGCNFATALALARALKITIEELAGLPPPVSRPGCVLPVVGTVGASVSRTGAWLDEGKTVSLTDCKGLVVHDESMNPVARDGQVVLYRPGDPGKSGDLVVVDLEDGLIFKQYHEVNGIHQFVSVNVSLALPAKTRKTRPKAMWKVVGIVME
jgi:DNA-binding XRE family transcriptional regulator